MWMGEVTIAADTNVFIDTADVGRNVTLPAGWYTSLYEVWRYIVAQWNVPGTYFLEISLDADGSVTITDASGIVEITITGDHEVLGLPSSTVNPAAAAYSISTGALVPCFGPVASYNKSFKVETGHMDRAVDGTLYSVVGKFQELRDIEVTLDNRDEDYSETAAWVNIWNAYWSLGLSVALYMEPIESHIPTTTNTTVGEALVMLSVEPVQMGRLIEYTNATPMQTVARTFAKKALFPLSLPQNRAWVHD